MEVLFEDIRRKLGAGDVRLPAAAAVVTEQPSLPLTSAAAAAIVATTTSKSIATGGSVVSKEAVFREDSGVDMSGDMRDEAARARELERGLRQLKLVSTDGNALRDGNTNTGTAMDKGKAVDVSVLNIGGADERAAGLVGGGAGGRA